MLRRSAASRFFGRSSLYSCRHASMKVCAWARVVNQCPLRHSSRNRSLVREVGLPEFVRSVRGMRRPGGGRRHDVGRAGAAIGMGTIWGTVSTHVEPKTLIIKHLL